MRDLSPEDQGFRDTVERQWGVVTLAQLREHGLGAGAVEHAVRRGRLIRLHRGVYAVGHQALRVQGRWLAAVLACGDGAALSHVAAAAALDLRASSARLIDVSVPVARRGHRGIRLHRPRHLEPGDVIVHRGIPTTSPTRTIIDLSRTLTLRALESVAAEAEHRGLLDHDRLCRARSRSLRAIFGPAPPARTRSRDEQRFLAAIRAAGLSEPESNVWLTHGGGEEWQPDFLFRRERVIVEIDDDRHKTAIAFERDRDKNATRQADGYVPLRFTRRQLREDLEGRVALLARTLALRNP